MKAKLLTASPLASFFLFKVLQILAAVKKMEEDGMMCESVDDHACNTLDQREAGKKAQSFGLLEFTCGQRSIV